MKVESNHAKLVPFPQQIISESTQLTIDSNNFKFIAKTKEKCDLLEEAIKRYRKISFINDCSLMDQYSANSEIKKSSEFQTDDNLTNVTIEVMGECGDQWPHMDMDEMYTIRVDTQDFPKQACIFSSSIWGALRALETFSQLIEHKSGSIFTINSTFILDFPRFTYRGLLIDTSRHFLPIHTILDNLDAMAFHKMNVLHWHIVDDQSFPYVSEKFPDLSSKGSYNRKTHVYSRQDIETVVNFARFRGIRVIVELDTPGHSLSWGKGYPELLTECYSQGKPNGQFGPLNPSRNYTYEFLNSLLEELSEKFADNYLHLGGDEVNYLCWKSNPEIQSFMKAMKMGTKYEKLEEYHFRRLFEIISRLNKTSILWQEVLDQMIEIPNNTIVNVWKQNYDQELYEITKRGFPVILSSCWYLNKISYGYDWFGYYKCDPQNFNGTEEQNRLVKGGQVSMWGEWVDGSNFLSRTWFVFLIAFYHNLNFNSY